MEILFFMNPKPIVLAAQKLIKLDRLVWRGHGFFYTIDSNYLSMKAWKFWWFGYSFAAHF